MKVQSFFIGVQKPIVDLPSLYRKYQIKKASIKLIPEEKQIIIQIVLFQKGRFKNSNKKIINLLSSYL